MFILVILTVSLAGLILSLRILRARPRSQDRTAMDWTDHVWAEIFIPSLGRWCHADPCEAAWCVCAWCVLCPWLRD